MADNISKRSGDIEEPTQESAWERTLFNKKSQQNAALILSGGKTTNLFLASAGRVFEGLDGLERSRSAFNQSNLLEFDARSAEIKGKSNALQALERLNDIQATNIVASFASGVRLQGSAAVVQQVVASQADFSAAISKANASLAAGSLRRKAGEAAEFARATKKRANEDIILGTISGATSLFL